MKPSLIFILLVSSVACFGCLDENIFKKSQKNPEPLQDNLESKEVQKNILIKISPKKNKWDGNHACNDGELHNQSHYYELYIDGNLVYRDRLRTTNEDDVPTKWQLPIGKHQIRVCADGFIPFDKEIEVLAKETRSSTIQYFGMVLNCDKNPDDKKPLCP